MSIGSTRRKSTRTGFTFAEVLAALVVMAIVIPVAIEGMRVANRAGVVAQRKCVAAQLADSLLNEIVVTEMWDSGVQSGDFGEERPGYRWRLVNETWGEGTLRLLTVEVTYSVQGQEFNVRLSTIVPLTSS